MATDKLTAKQELFVAEYLVDLNASAAYKRAGYACKNDNVAGVEANRLLNNPKVQQRISEAMEKRVERTKITQDMVLQRWWEIATADPNELIAFRRCCCRNCFGKNHHYQWTDEEEFQRAVAVERMAAQEAKRAPRDLTDEGGYGFDRTLRPHPKCPECHGEGNGEVFAKDTRDASPQARALYAGVKVTKDGMEIKMRDQDAALTNVARHLGMFIDRKEIGGPGDFQDLTEDELDRQIKEQAKHAGIGGQSVH